MADRIEQDKKNEAVEESVSVKKVMERLAESGFGEEINEKLVGFEGRNHANALYRAHPTG